MRRYEHAFTLVEVAVVVLIVALSVTMAFPRFGWARVQQARLRSSANRMASVAQYAHQRAACTRLMHMLHIDKATGQYWVTSRTLDERLPGRERSGVGSRLPDGVQFAGLELRGTDPGAQDAVVIRFSPQGWADAAVLNLVCSTGDCLSVVIDSWSSQVKICEVQQRN